MARAPVCLNAALVLAGWSLATTGCGARSLARDAARDQSGDLGSSNGDGGTEPVGPSDVAETTPPAPDGPAAELGGAEDRSDARSDARLDAGSDAAAGDAAAEAPPPYVPGYLGSVVVGGDPVGGFAPWQNPSALAIGPDGALYFAGTFDDPIDFDPGPAVDRRTAQGYGAAFVTRFAADGHRDWTLTFGGDTALVTVQALAVDAGSLVVVGRVQGAGEIDLDPGPGVLLGYPRESNENAGYVSRFSLDGKLLWAGTFRANSDCTPFAVAIDASGAVYAAGGFKGLCDFDPGPGTDERTPGQIEGGFLVALAAADGHLAWVRTFGGAPCEGHVNGVTVAASGDVWAAGVVGAGDGCLFGDQKAPSDQKEGALIAAFSASGLGHGIWKLGGAHANAIAAAPGGALYVGGDALGSVDFDPGPGLARRDLPSDKASPTAFVLSLRADGGLTWLQTLPLTSVRSLASLGAGGVLSLGTSPNLLSPPLGFLVSRFDAGGSAIWSFRVGDPDLHVHAIAAGASMFAVSGGAWDSDDLDPGSAADIVPSRSTFFARYAF